MSLEVCFAKVNVQMEARRVIRARRPTSPRLLIVCNLSASSSGLRACESGSSPSQPRRSARGWWALLRPNTGELAAQTRTFWLTCRFHCGFSVAHCSRVKRWSRTSADIKPSSCHLWSLGDRSNCSPARSDWNSAAVSICAEIVKHLKIHKTVC